MPEPSESSTLEMWPFYTIGCANSLVLRDHLTGNALFFGFSSFPSSDFFPLHLLSTLVG